MFELSEPRPDFASLERVIRGTERSERVRLAELFLDPEMRQHIAEHLMGEPWVAFDRDPRRHWHQQVRIYAALGYDYVPVWLDLVGAPLFHYRLTDDTAALPRAQRAWVEESYGVIRDWSDFHAVQWDSIELDARPVEYCAEVLPPGMKVVVVRGFWEDVLERFMGYEGLFTLMFENPDLVAATFETFGERIALGYSRLVGEPEIGAVFHADDLGHKTGTLVHPDFLRQHVFPWFRRFTAIAHAKGKTCWYHCCGNVRDVLDDIVGDIGFDAFHSFQDVIMPIAEFQRLCGGRIAVLGGVDMDALARLPTEQLRGYVRRILDACMPRGRFALGSGNTVANYIPPENYLTMLETGREWRREGTET